MKKISIVAMPTSARCRTETDHRHRPGDRSNWYCVLDESGQMLLEVKGVGTLIALTGLLTLEGAHDDSATVGAYAAIWDFSRD